MNYIRELFRDNKSLCIFCNVFFGYLLYAGLAYYVYQYIEELDMSINSSVQTNANSLIMMIVLYCINLSQAVVLSLYVYRYIVMIHFSIIFYTASWLIIYIKNMIKNCKLREYLELCNTTIVDNRDQINNDVLNNSIDILQLVLCSIITIQIIYTGISMIQNRHIRYFFSKNTYKEFLFSFIVYYTYSGGFIAIPMIIMLLFCCMFGGGGGSGDCDLTGCNFSTYGYYFNNSQVEENDEKKPTYNTMEV